MSETGVWAACGTGFCLSGNPLDLAGITGTDFAALEGATVTVLVDKTPAGWVVLEITP